ncbi:ABC transporter substrate-binding protein [Massilia glaciei]|uniref:Amino acid-binding protein n=1 Tax=Massilia glaciei TaxID=1524097 RepID=A0A2U2HID4_9BURK|nr:ABC transporter substrate-binding protein [Massilia glaciei]PWF46110.1 amino acid-binding protein [Massilia glaciei]
MKFRAIVSWSLFALAAAGAPALAAGPAIVIGQAIDLSGSNGSIGRDYVAGITTYFDSVNAKGGIKGRKIQYIVRDDRGEPAETARLVGELIRQDRAVHLLGGIGAESTEAVLAAPAFAQTRQVLFAPLADSFASPGGRVLFWRPGIEQELRFLLGYFEKLGIKTVGVAYQQSAQNSKTYRFVLTEMARRKMRLAGSANMSGSDAENARRVAALSKSGAKMVLTIADTTASSVFLKTFRKHDSTTFVAGTSLINLQTLSQIAGSKATAWTVFSQVVPNPEVAASPLQSEHIAMMRKFRDEPMSSMTLEGFAVAKTLARAIERDPVGYAGGPVKAIDLGGMSIVAGGQGGNLSQFVDIAMLKQSGGLMY